MNNPEDEYIFKCPHCHEEITRLYYSVNTSESGTVNIYKTNSQIIRNIQPENHGLYLEDYETDDTSWNDNPTFQCHNCEHPIEINEIIIEKIQEEKEIEKIPIPEENDAVESITKIIIKTTNKTKDPYDFCKIGLCRCPNCKHLFCSESDRFMDKEEFVLCPKCGEEINAKTNSQEIINKTLTT